MLILIKNSISTGFSQIKLLKLLIIIIIINNFKKNMRIQLQLDNPLIVEHTYINLNSVNIKYKRKEYIISTTHNYPLINVDMMQVLWNELFIMEIKKNTERICVESKNTIYNLQYKIPPANSTVLLHNYELLINESLTLMSFDGLNKIYIPYITATFKEKIKHPDLLRGLSGSPIFIIIRYYDNKNDKIKYIKKIIGIFSQFNMHTNQAYIIPSYFVKKTLDRKDNLNIYTLPNIETIKKIGRFNISKEDIFHHIFGNIPVSTFLLIEGDCDKDMVIQELEYPLSSRIIIEDGFYIVNSKLVSILKKMKKYDIIKNILSNKLKKIKISL
jgi:hypothetical protein